MGFGVIALDLVITRFCMILGSQMLNILDAQLFISKMVMEIPKRFICEFCYNSWHRIVAQQISVTFYFLY